MDNIIYHKGKITRNNREKLLRQKGCVVWITGLSGSGKSTIAVELEDHLFKREHICYLLDGDNIRSGLNSDLGFSPEDRRENIRRVGEVAALIADIGIIALTAFISPFRADRERARTTIGEERFIEVYLDVPVEICEKRDPKKLYRRARTGEIPEFTGISSDYEIPENPNIVLDTSCLNVDSCVAKILNFLVKKQFIPVDEIQKTKDNSHE